MEKYRIYLFVGAGLMLLSMPLVAFKVNWFGEMQSWYGAFMWLMSATMIFHNGVNFHALTLAMLIAAAFNIPQCIFPFLGKPRQGTSKPWVWSFSVVAVVFVPTLAILIILNEHSANKLREGYFVYQAGYIISAIGFHMKRTAFKQAEAIREEV